MLKRIHIKGYKSLVDAEVELKPLAVLFGPNAAGKSNFLDALQLLSRITCSRTLKDAFDPPYRGKPLESFTFGEEGLAGLLKKDSAAFELEADVELSPHVIESVNRQIEAMKWSKKPDRTAQNAAEKVPDQEQKPADDQKSPVREHCLRYRIKVEILPKSGLLRVADEYLAALNPKTGEPRGHRKAFLEAVGERLHLRMEGQAHPTYYERCLDHSILSLPLYPPHYPHLVAMRQELASWFFFYFEPRERMRAPNAVREVRHIGLMGEELASFLNTLRALDEPQFKAVEQALQMIVPSVNGIQVGVNSLGEVELSLLEDGVPVPARVVSEGTLRVLGLLALSGAKEPPALLGFEEPENGIHPRRIRLVAELLRTRSAEGSTQTIVTTHSPILPDLIPDDCLYICRKRDRRTEIRSFSSWGALARKADIDQALDEAPTVSERILRGDFDA